MDFAQTEMTVVENNAVETAKVDPRDLAELQLALVGGGIGDTII
jgi:hypothetical protein